MKMTDLSGSFEVILSDGSMHTCMLPGTLDENKIGERDKPCSQWHPAEGLGEADDRNKSLIKDDIITTRLTRKYTYTGIAIYKKVFDYEVVPDKRVFLEVERTRKLMGVFLNGKKIDACIEGTLSTPYVYEVTDAITEKNELKISCDNTYEGWPKDAVLYSSAATDETQTNWNGLLGYIRLCEEEEVFIRHVQIYCRDKAAYVKVIIDAAKAYEGEITLKSEAFSEQSDIRKEVKLSEGVHEVIFEDIELKRDVLLWDEYEGNLYKASAGGSSLESKEVLFGIREFDGKNGYLNNNGHRIFLRSEANCCVFPETGHMPLEPAEWRSIMELYKSYGINCIRFHSHCPPDAAFTAADELGMFVQPELSHWDPKNAFATEESYNYYETELRRILYWYANHPSFVMLSLGNELWANEDIGVERMKKLVRLARSIDSTRLYATGSNAFYGERGADEESDFYTSVAYFKDDLRGTSAGMVGYINNEYPNAKTNYDKTMEKIRADYKKPVFSFEVGQYEVLPDFDELEEYNGVTIPDNIKAIRDAIEATGYDFLNDWKKRVEVTGELSYLAYREEIEAALRTSEMSGISLLGLQDFTGQGTALVGMLNPHLKPKPFDFARPERFKKFFNNVVLLVLLDKYTYFENETFRAEVKLADYSKNVSVTAEAVYEVWDGDRIYKKGSLTKNKCSCKNDSLGMIEFDFKPEGMAKRLELRVYTDIAVTEYPIWIYPDEKADFSENIVFAQSFNKAMEALNEGKKVFLEPECIKESFCDSIKTCFTTDFWSVGTFPSQEGYMGCMVEPEHEMFAKFPTKFFPEWQWWIITRSRAMIIPAEVKPLIEVLDCYARLRKMAFAFEGRVGNGRLFVSSMGLMEKLEYPEARALFNSIVAYMDSEAFAPEELSKEVLKKIIIQR